MARNERVGKDLGKNREILVKAAGLGLWCAPRQLGDIHSARNEATSGWERRRPACKWARSAKKDLSWRLIWIAMSVLTHTMQACAPGIT